jgi:hypothetical protein
MTQRNERIQVRIPDNESEDGGETWDQLYACGWTVTADGQLNVDAWRGGSRTRVATYRPGQWYSVIAMRNLKV